MRCWAAWPGLASNFVFLLALLLFLSVETGGAGDRLASIAADRPRIAEALGHFAWGTRQYLLVTTVFGFIVAVLDSIALALLGIPLAVTWGLLSFITNYIPNIGFIIGVVPPALLGLLTGGPTADGDRHRRLLRAQLRRAVDHPAPLHRRRGRAVGHGDLRGAVVLGVVARPARARSWPSRSRCWRKALLVDIDPQARWADALLRASAKEPDPAAPTPVKKSRRRRRDHGADPVDGSDGQTTEQPVRATPDVP